MSNLITHKTNVFFCNCLARIISDEKLNAIRLALSTLGVDVFELHDLCACSLSERERLNHIASAYSKKYIIACYPRAIEHLLKQNGIDFGNYEVLNFRELSVNEIIERISLDIETPTQKGNYTVIKSKLDVPAWYPVIDQTRCTLCGQCARFCLFGVYKYNKQSLHVVRPLSCKNNCPACGRTCPASAIIFPRLAENSELSGAESSEGKGAQNTEKEGLFLLLNERNKMRKSIFKPGVLNLAHQERDKAIKDMEKEEGGKP